MEAGTVVAWPWDAWPHLHKLRGDHVESNVSLGPVWGWSHMGTIPCVVVRDPGCGVSAHLQAAHWGGIQRTQTRTGAPWLSLPSVAPASCPKASQDTTGAGDRPEPPLLLPLLELLLLHRQHLHLLLQSAQLRHPLLRGQCGSRWPSCQGLRPAHQPPVIEPEPWLGWGVGVSQLGGARPVGHAYCF